MEQLETLFAENLPQDEMQAFELDYNKENLLEILKYWDG